VLKLCAQNVRWHWSLQPGARNKGITAVCVSAARSDEWAVWLIKVWESWSSVKVRSELQESKSLLKPTQTGLNMNKRWTLSSWHKSYQWIIQKLFFVLVFKLNFSFLAQRFLSSETLFHLNMQESDRWSSYQTCSFKVQDDVWKHSEQTVPWHYCKNKSFWPNIACIPVKLVILSL